MDEKEKILGQTEFMHHSGEYERLKLVVNHLLVSMDFHSRQMETWNNFLSQDQPTAEVVAKRPILTLIINHDKQP
jgi:hypothetical protein